ncbi:MAG: PEGA domain-containing protein [Brevinematales bacterium]|nr:PEGA domain-containing protein [Brevinematales bacterium]
MKRSLIIFCLALAISTLSCTPNINKLKITEPVLKTDIVVSIAEIKSIKTNYIIDLSHKVDLITKLGEKLESPKHEDETKDITITNITSNEKAIQTSQDQTNLIPTKTKKFIDLDNIIKNTISINLKNFIRYLSKYNYSVEEIKILNRDKIEEEILKTYNDKEIKEYTYTKYTTNFIKQTNYYVFITNTNILVAEIVDKNLVIEEIKLKDNIFLSNVLINYDWVLKLTNGVNFTEGSKGDFSILVFYDIYESPINRYLTNIIISMVVIVSNQTTSNFILMKTNLELIDFLSTDRKVFNQLKPFFYNYRTGILKVETKPEDVDILVNDLYMGRGKTTPEFFSEGIHKITLSKGPLIIDEYVYLKSGALNIYSKDLSENYKNTKKLYINSIPLGADTFIESQYIGKTPTNIVLPTGKYRIWLKKNNLEKFLDIELNSDTNLSATLQDLNQNTEYNVMTGITILLGIATVSSISMFFWADSQERYYDFLYNQYGKPEYQKMREYYYYFKDNMRTTSITGTIATLILWGITLGIESDKFYIKLNHQF